MPSLPLTASRRAPLQFLLPATAARRERRALLPTATPPPQPQAFALRLPSQWAPASTRASRAAAVFRAARAGVVARATTTAMATTMRARRWAVPIVASAGASAGASRCWRCWRCCWVSGWDLGWDSDRCDLRACTASRRGRAGRRPGGTPTPTPTHPTGRRATTVSVSLRRRTHHGMRRRRCHPRHVRHRRLWNTNRPTRPTRRTCRRRRLTCRPHRCRSITLLRGRRGPQRPH